MNYKDKRVILSVAENCFESRTAIVIQRYVGGVVKISPNFSYKIENSICLFNTVLP